MERLALAQRSKGYAVIPKDKVLCLQLSFDTLFLLAPQPQAGVQVGSKQHRMEQLKDSQLV